MRLTIHLPVRCSPQQIYSCQVFLSLVTSEVFGGAGPAGDAGDAGPAGGARGYGACWARRL